MNKPAKATRHQCGTCGAVRNEQYMQIVKKTAKRTFWNCINCDDNRKRALRFNGLRYVGLWFSLVLLLACKESRKSEMRDMQCMRIDTHAYVTLELPSYYIPGDTIMYGHYHNTDSPYCAWYVVLSN